LFILVRENRQMMQSPQDRICRAMGRHSYQCVPAVENEADQPMANFVI
jgi:hypothetical protein